MNIEVVSKKGDPNKIKGDLLEKLSKDLLKAQGYDVIEEIRFTGVELDLLCKHKVSNKQIYVECKAQKEKIGAPVLRQLLGTVMAYDYSEGWLISTSDFGKEAKGFTEMWKQKPHQESSKLSFYQPNMVISSLISASVICEKPKEAAVHLVNGEEYLGEWILVLSEFGRFWAVYTIQGGTPSGVLFFHVQSGKHVKDEKLIENLSLLESSFAEYDLKTGLDKQAQSTITTSQSSTSNVVEVQIGDSWDDYRPSRPQDFVGRDDTQKEILSFLKSANNKTSDNRIFAITGNSGLGKSSLVAKVRDRSRNKFYKNRYFVFAVDMRGAKNPTYITASIIKCLKSAQEAGFGQIIDLQLTDPSNPLSSPSISKYLESVEEKGQVICLIFDQFEELYSKPELFGVFTSAKDLMLDVASQKSNFVLGFAWKTDSTTQQDHPAYHMWHDLSDYRRVYKLNVFDNGEIAKALTTFEKEVGVKITAEIRHQIIHSSQGFPWLIKKLCINLYESLKKGDDTETLLLDLDVRRLFEGDIDLLTPSEHTCLKLIAQKAPADWSEIIETSGVSILNGLVHKRLVIKSGDRLNIYWDIFKDYLLTGNVPVVPFNYIPTSDITSMMKVFENLSISEFYTSEKIADSTELNERTVWNIGADLVMFGLAERISTSFKIHRDIAENNEMNFLKRLREKLSKHSLKLAIYKNHAGKTVTSNTVTESLIMCLPQAKFSSKTFNTYANRLTVFFVYTGYFVRVGRNVTVQDIGSPVFDTEKLPKRGKQRGLIFPASASPASVCELLALIEDDSDLDSISKKGYRNALTVLKRFDLVLLSDTEININKDSINKFGGYREAIWTLAKNEPSIAKCMEQINKSYSITGLQIGEFISNEYKMNWSEATQLRNGNALKQWSNWVRVGIISSSIPTPPGRGGDRP